MLKVIVTGPESSGKTSLSHILADYFDVPLVEEYAREYLGKKETPQYKQADLIDIAKGQIALEQDAIRKAQKSLVMCDTDLLTIKIWSMEVFGQCDAAIEHLYLNSLKNFSTLYLLCSPENIPWEFDILRENPHDRDRLFQVYEKELLHNEHIYFILRGGIEARFEVAKRYIEQMLEGK